MGPRSFDRGNTAEAPNLSEEKPLQWGHDLSIVETLGLIQLPWFGQLQWGHDLSIVETSLLTLA